MFIVTLPDGQQNNTLIKDLHHNYGANCDATYIVLPSGNQFAARNRFFFKINNRINYCKEVS